MQFKFFDPYAATRVTRNRLPHWEQKGALYFVTFHLADSIPAEVRARIERRRDAWLARHPEPWSAETEQEYRELYLGEVERALDEGRGLCPLRAAACSGVAAEALQHFDGDRVDVMAFVVMPNHVHTAVIPRGDWSLEKLVHSWKRWSAVRVNRLTGKAGELWQPDYFDTIVRDRVHLGRVLRYIRNNPAKAGLREGEFVLYESEFARGWLQA